MKSRIEILEDLLDINMQVCRSLWHMASVETGKVGALTPKLILPQYRSSAKVNSLRISEQEARQMYSSAIERSDGYYYTIETPTEELHNFTGEASLSARSDLSLFVFEGEFQKKVNVEFKAHNADPQKIDKDIEKLAREKIVGNWFHLLKNADRGTFKALFEKFRSSIVEHFAEAETDCPVVFCFCILDLRVAILKVFFPHQDTLQQDIDAFFQYDYETLIKPSVIHGDAITDWLYISDPVPSQLELAAALSESDRINTLISEFGYVPATAKAFVRSRGRCAYCGEPQFVTRTGYSSAGIDHILPRAIYPQFEGDERNWVMACSSCNTIKKNFDPLKELIDCSDPNAALENRREELIDIVRGYLQDKLGKRAREWERVREILGV